MPSALPHPCRVICAVLISLATPAAAQERVDATLAGHAVLPAVSFSAPPEDAPRETFVSGKFLRPDARVDTPASVPRRTGLATPFLGQPLQGFSGYAAARAEGGGLLALIDNGFGAKLNSSDALLSFAILAPDFDTGTLEVLDRVWLHDPDRRVPFRIVHEATGPRYLTGADFDPESIQRVGDEIWIGEEFGPYLISATPEGRITGVYPTELEGRVIRSPDHPALRVGAEAGTDYVVPRSGGFEGMALGPRGTLLAMLEKPLLNETGAPEGDFLRVLEFDPEARAWTGASFRFRLSEGAVAIGDFNMIDDTRALVIERDGGQGDPRRACAEDTDGGDATADCFPNPAQVKTVTLVDLADVGAGGDLTRLRQIDLMDIADPDGLAQGAAATDTDGAGRFTFPFVTIESVMRDGPAHILVANDNNLPFSTGRSPSAPDANEIIRLHVPDLLAE